MPFDSVRETFSGGIRITEKQCANPECAKLLPLSEFGVDTRTKDGHTKLCKTCFKTYGKIKFSPKRNLKGTKKCKECGKFFDVSINDSTCKCPHCETEFNITKTIGDYTSHDNRFGFRLWQIKDMGDPQRKERVINYIKQHPLTHSAEIAKRLSYKVVNVRRDIKELKDAGKIKMFIKGNFHFIEWIQTENLEVLT